MIEFIKQLFKDNNAFNVYTLDLSSSNFFAESTDINRKEFFLIIETEDLTPFIKETEESSIEAIYSLLIKQGFYKLDFNKNTALIFLLKTNAVQPADKLKRQIYEIEENPYFFKKHVLLYTDNQLADLKSKCPDVSQENLESLVNYMNFEEFKNAPYADNYKNLLLNIYVKLSFLKTPSKKKEIENLTIKISESLEAAEQFQDLETLRLKVLGDDGTQDVYDLFNIPKAVVNE
ncbi:MAG TPA: ABC-three component system middle component 1 [Bacteroidia bacterium]|jgi:hypothetical protein